MAGPWVYNTPNGMFMGTGRAPYMNGVYGSRRGGPNQRARTGLWEIGRPRHHYDWYPPYQYYGPGRGAIFRNNHFYNPNLYFGGGPWGGPDEDDDSDEEDNFPDWVPRRRRAPRRVREDDGPRRLPWNENNFYNNIPVNAPNVPVMPGMRMHQQNFPQPFMY